MEAQRYEAEWRKAARSTANGACVEVCCQGTEICVRDSKNTEGAVLGFRGESWRFFVTRTKIKGLAKATPWVANQGSSDAA